MNIRKIIREEIDDDFGWIKEIPAFLPGKGFDDDMVCYSEAEDCTVKILEDRIIFSLEIKDFVNDWCGPDNEWVLPDLFENAMNNRTYDGNGDYYEFDSDEFNYSGYHVDDRLKDRTVELMLQIDNDLSEDEVRGWFSDYALTFEDHMRYPKIYNYFDNLVGEVLSALGYAVQENRWISVSGEFHNKIEEIENKGVDVEVKWYYGDSELVVTVPMEVVNKIHREKQFRDLSELFEYVMKPIIDIPWYDWFYDEWDSSGASDRINEAWATFLDLAEDYMENDKWEEEKEFVNYCYRLLDSQGWRLRSEGVNRFEKVIPGRGNSRFYLNINSLDPMVIERGETIEGRVWPSWGSSWRDGKIVKLEIPENVGLYESFEKFLDLVEEKSKELLKLPSPPNRGVARF